MANLDFDLGVLERQLHQARQNAIQAELAAAGLQEIGHPMLLCVLGVTGERRPGTPVRTQRELARLLHVSPAAVTTSLKSLERKGYILREPGDGDARCNRVLLTEKGQQALEKLGDDEKELICLRYWYGYGLKEIAQKEGLPLTTIYGRLKKVLKKLEKLLK